MKKFNLFLKPNRLACPESVELEPERILCNDVTLPGDFNPHTVRLWVVGNEFGAIVAVWAAHEQDAIDEAIDSGLAEGILIQPYEADDDTPTGGNASEPYDGENTWLAEVVFEPVRDLLTLLKFAEARGAREDNLDF